MVKWKKVTAVAMAAICTVTCLSFTGEQIDMMAAESTEPAITTLPGTVRTESEMNGSFLSVSGYAKGNVNDRSAIKEGDDNYAVVSTEEEFLDALNGAMSGDINVIELRDDMYLGWWELSDEAKTSGVVEPFEASESLAGAPVGNPTLIESGISTLTLDGIDGLTIFSKTGCTIYHVNVKLNSDCNDVIIRNLAFDDVWEWDDWRDKGYGQSGGKGIAKRTGWTFLKVNGAHNIWIDHCDFGISFDGNLDIENGANGVSITWCKFGDTDYSVGSMLYRTIVYLEDIYQDSKKDSSVASFNIYGLMRDNGLTKEEIALYMGYHKKNHLAGSGDKDTWLYKDENGNIVADETKTDANELIRVSFGYNVYENIGSRLPLMRGGVGHLYNCYVNNYNVCQAAKIIGSKKNAEGISLREQIDNKGGATHFLSRGLNPRCGGTTAADTCYFDYVDDPLIYSELDGNMGEYTGYYGYNYGLIVNSTVTKSNGTNYTGSSWDNDGENPFTNAVTWEDKSTMKNWKWGWEGDNLAYGYKTVPLESVRDVTTSYGGCRTIDMSAEDWLKTEYDSSYEIKLVDKKEVVEVEEITLSKEEVTVYMGEYLQLYEKVQPVNANEAKVDYNWISSNPEVATVNDCGLVKPVSVGTTVVTVTTAGGKTASCEVTVEELPTEIEVMNLPTTLYVGDFYTLQAYARPVTVSNGNVIWMNMGIRLDVLDELTGRIQAVKTGKAQIMAESVLKGNRVGSVAVNKKVSIQIVAPDVPVTGIASQCTNVALKPGDSVTLDAGVVPSDATNQKIYYESEDEAIAVVDENGKVTAVTEGSVKMTATTMNYGYKTEYMITVSKNAVDNPIPGPTDTPSVMKGDVNLDGDVTLDDANEALKAALGINDLSGDKLVAADVVEPDGITLEDAKKILLMALGIE